MTSPHDADYLPPTDWSRFERLCQALLSDIYKRQFQRWGRGGQRQDGVDVFAIMGDGKAIALQCKGRSQSLGRKLTVADINAAVESMESFRHPIDEFIILTTANDDVVLHDRAAAISVERIARGKCRVSVWGWNAICDQIGAHERIQRAYFGHWFQRASFRQWVARGVAICLLVILSVIGTKEFVDWKRIKDERRTASVRELQYFVKLTDDLKAEYIKCDDVLAENVFTFSAKMRQSCTQPIASRLDEIDKEIEKVGALLDSGAWTEMNSLSKLMGEDYRQGLIAVEMTNFFEEEIIRGLKDFCIKPAFRPPADTRREAAYRAARNAITRQLNYYFVLRDFILPGLSSMKARALVRARMLANEPLPTEMVKQANELTAILRERNGYVYLEPKRPFTISVMKVWSTRSIAMPSNSEVDPLERLERARWLDLYLAAQTKVFYDRPKEVEELIQCGLLKPAARSLAKKL